MRTGSRESIGYVNAGGRGTRLSDLFNPDAKTGVAKALLPIGEPQIKLVDHHINNLRQQGIEKVVIATGDQHQVFEYINDVYGGKDNVVATRSLEQLGTGGDLVEYARQNESSENILVQNVDTILDIDLEALLYEFNRTRELGGLATIALTLSKGVPNEGAYEVTESGKVRRSKEFYNVGAPDDQAIKYQASSTGAVVIEAGFLRQHAWQLKDGQLSLYRDILKDAWERGGLFAYDNGTRFFRDIGTTATWLASQGDEELQQYLRYNKTV